MAADATLECRTITKTYGSLQALSEVSLQVREGTIAGLIGPNGSGKTTLINVLSGITAPTAGTVSAGGAPLTGRAPNVYLRSGIARTFQNIRLFRQLSVLENVEVGVAGLGRDRRRAIRAKAWQWLDKFELVHEADREAGTLPYGAQRRLEIARAVAASPRFLLLDEPAAGMNEGETERLGKMLRETREQLGLGVLLVEHDVRFTLSLCSYITVLSNGTKIAEGRPDVIREDRNVIETYLGSSAA